MGRGSKDSGILILGEAPGGEEERTGAVFSGAAGKLLNQVLKESGLAARNPYISNVVKCRPPDNRAPTRAEWEACRRYLSREVEALNPHSVLLLGNTALQAVWGRSGITKNRGVRLNATGTSNSIGLGSAQLFATIHPAYALRNPGQLPTLTEDFRRFQRLIDGQLKARDVKRYMLTSTSQVKRVCAYLKANATHIAYDVENRYVPWMGKEWSIVCLGLTMDGDKVYVIPLHHPESPFRKKWKRLLRDYVKPLMEDKRIKFIAQNGKHDNLQLAGAGVFAEHTFDIMLAAHLLDENRPKNLGFLSQTLLGADVYKGMVEVKPDKIMLQPLRGLCDYNGYDVGYTFQLYKPLREELLKHSRLTRIFVKLLMPASHMIQQVEYAGVYVDKERLYSRMHQLQDMIDDQLSVLNEWGAGSLNPNSPQQLAKWLYGKEEDGGLGLNPIEYTKSGNYSTREGVLQWYNYNPAVRALLKYRTLQLKWMNTNLMPWSLRLDERSRLHTTYKLYGTVTGRLSGDLQQVPRDPFIRTVFGAPPGWQFIQADYSQIELRIVAHIAGERRMLRAFNVGEDLHLVTATQLTGKPSQDVSKEERKRAKAVNFGFVYGMWPKKFQTYAFENYELIITLEQAQEARARFFRTFPDLTRWHERQERLVETRGWVQSPIGRIRHLPDVHSSDRGVKAEAIRQSINSPVQSMASDMMLFGMVKLHQRLDPRECFMVMTLHDGIMFQCREDKVEKWAPVIKEVLETLPLRRTFGTNFSVPIVADVEGGQYWGEPTWQLNEQLKVQEVK